MSKRVWVVTGGKGVGKSTALATFPWPPEELARALVVDTEDSMADIVDQVKFGGYIRMYERLRADVDILDAMARGKPPWASAGQRSAWSEYYGYFVKRLNAELANGKYKYLMIDTVEPIEAAMTAAVETNAAAFGWSGSRAYGRMETEGVRPLYEWLLEAVSRRGVQEILLSSHIKPVWLDDRPVIGKVNPGGRMAVLARLSTAMLWLVHEPRNPDGAPAAIVLKARIGKIAQGKDGWILRRTLPARMPHFTWRDLWRYDMEPANYLSPEPGEVLSEQEQEMISELLSKAQMEHMVLGAQQRATVTWESTAESMPTMPAPPTSVSLPLSDNGPNLQQAKALALAAQGKGVDDIAKELQLPPLLVKGWLK